MDKYFTTQNALIMYAALSAAANAVKLFAPPGSLAAKVCDKVLALGMDLHKLMGV